MTQDAFDKTLELSADAFFLLPGSEYVTYFPASGASRKIRAVVNRPGPERIAEIGGGREVSEVLVKNSGDDGIASTEVDTGGDKIQMAARAGRVPVLMRITRVISQDAGMIKLKVQV